MPDDPRIPAGERVYAIGDVHGRLDLLGELLGMIRRDNDKRGEARTTLIQLGDLVDRGPASAGIVRSLMTYTARNERMIVLQGNHEAMMLGALAGDRPMMAHWLRVGGRATLESWGVSAALLDQPDDPTLPRVAREHVSTRVLDWIEARPLSHRIGDYFFVHAGIRPGIALSRQTPDDQLWIREAFLDSEADHGAMIVHGHSVCEDGPIFRPNRIGLDTGAYATGRLSAIGLEGPMRWTITTGFAASDRYEAVRSAVARGEPPVEEIAPPFPEPVGYA